MYSIYVYVYVYVDVDVDVYIYNVSLWGYTYVVICLKHLGDMSWDFLIVEMGNPFLNSRKG